MSPVRPTIGAGGSVLAELLLAAMKTTVQYRHSQSEKLNGEPVSELVDEAAASRSCS